MWFYFKIVFQGASCDLTPDLHCLAALLAAMRPSEQGTIRSDPFPQFHCLSLRASGLAVDCHADLYCLFSVLLASIRPNKHGISRPATLRTSITQLSTRGLLHKEHPDQACFPNIWYTRNIHGQPDAEWPALDSKQEPR